MKRDAERVNAQMPKRSEDWPRISYRLTRDGDRFVFVCMTGARSVI